MLVQNYNQLSNQIEGRATGVAEKCDEYLRERKCGKNVQIFFGVSKFPHLPQFETKWRHFPPSGGGSHSDPKPSTPYIFYIFLGYFLKHAAFENTKNLPTV